MRKISEINIHCSATGTEFNKRTIEYQVREINSWHKNNGWQGIGYHYIIGRKGELRKGRGVASNGAFEPKVNRKAIGICLIGGFGGSENQKFEDNFTKEQDRVLRKLIKDLKEEYPRIKKISGHNEYSAKACPCFDVTRWYKNKQPKKVIQEAPIISGAVGGTGIVVVETLNQATTALEPISNISETIRYIFVGLVLLSVFITIYTKLKKC